MAVFGALILGSSVTLFFVPAWPLLIWPVVFVWGACGGALYTLAMIDIGAREKGITLVNSTAVLVLTYTLGGLVASAASGALIQWSSSLAFPLVLTGVACGGVMALFKAQRQPSLNPDARATAPPQ